MNPISYLIALVPAVIAMLLPQSKENEIAITILFIAAFMVLVGSATIYWFKQTKPVAVIAKVFGILILLFLGAIAFAAIKTQSTTLDNIFSVAIGVSAMYYKLGTDFIEVYTEK